MSKIEPFEGIRYTKRVPLNTALSRPYDVISHKEKQVQIRRYPFSALVIDKPEESPGGYVQVGQTLSEWLSRGILRRDEMPTLTVTEERFFYRDQERIRRSLWAAVGLSRFGRDGVFAHENTYTGPKEDRRRLLLASGLNTSPIFGLFSGDSSCIQHELAKICAYRPMARASYQDSEVAVYVVLPSEFSPEFFQELRQGQIVIADGHHRYETALDVHENEGTKFKRADAVLMAITPDNSSGLVVRPTHRLAKAQSEAEYVSLMRSIETTHDLHLLELVDDLHQMEQLLEKVKGKGVFGLVRREGDRVLASLARPKSPKQFLQKLEACYPNHSESYYDLDVVAVDGFVSTNETCWEPERDCAKLVEHVRTNACYVGFVVRPVMPETVCLLALKGDRVPPKTTFFDPKLPTGVVFRSLEPVEL